MSAGANATPALGGLECPYRLRDRWVGSPRRLTPETAGGRAAARVARREEMARLWVAALGVLVALAWGGGRRGTQ